MKTCGNRALVTGATGFIGAHLVERLQSEGWEVDIIVRRQTEERKFAPSVRMHEYDGHIESLNKAVAAARPDVVFHIASKFLGSHAPAEVEMMISSNVLFGTQLLEAMSAHGVQNLVNVGSYWQHYRNADYDPVNLYAATKQAFDALLTYYVNARNISVVTLELFDTYGANDTRPKLMQLLYAAWLEGRRLQMSPGRQRLSLVHIDDVMNAFLMAAERLYNDEFEGKETYVVDADRPVTLRELVRIFGEVTGSPIDVDWGAQPYRARQMMEPYTRGQRLPGWQPAIELADGLRSLYSSPMMPLGEQHSAGEQHCLQCTLAEECVIHASERRPLTRL